MNIHHIDSIQLTGFRERDIVAVQEIHLGQVIANIGGDSIKNDSRTVAQSMYH